MDKIIYKSTLGSMAGIAVVIITVIILVFMIDKENTADEESENYRGGWHGGGGRWHGGGRGYGYGGPGFYNYRRFIRPYGYGPYTYGPWMNPYYTTVEVPAVTSRNVIVRFYYDSSNPSTAKQMAVWQAVKNTPNLAEVSFIETDIDDDNAGSGNIEPIITKTQSGIMTRYTGLMEYNSLLDWILKY